MKILITSDTYLPAIGGAEMHVKYLNEGLMRVGHETMLFTTQDGENDLGVVRHAWDRNFISLIRALDRHIRTFKPDVIAAQYAYRLGMISGLLGRIRGIPVLVTLHGQGILPPAHPSLRGRIQHAVYRWVSLKAASRVVSTSASLAKVAEQYIPASKIVIIPNGAPAEHFASTRLDQDDKARELKERFSKKKVILTVRRLNPKCGIQYLIEAMPEIIRRHPDVLYVMVGTGRLEASLHERVRQLGLENNVLMLGALPNSEIPAYIASADIVVFPSTAESTSISCIEAMMAGKAIVASKVGGLIELLGRNEERGKLVQLVESESNAYDAPPIEGLTHGALGKLATVISDLLDNPAERDRLGRDASAYAVANFDWKTIVGRTVSEYEAVIRSASKKS